MFASDTAAGTHASFHQLAPSFLDVANFFAGTRVETDQGMQITVARMKDVGDAQMILSSNLKDTVQYFRQPRAGHYCVLNHRIRRNTTDSAKRPFACRPEFFPFVLIASQATIPGAILQADTLHPLCLVI